MAFSLLVTVNQIPNMKHIWMLLVLSSNAAMAQHAFIARILDADSHAPVAGASVFFEKLKMGATSHADGIVAIAAVPAGTRVVYLSCMGYDSRKISLEFPKAGADTLVFTMEPAEESLDSVIISTTRNNSYVKDLPVRVEVIGEDDINEKIGSTPANVSELLGEASGIQVLPTSLSTGNVSVRIQGLEGRYTQILKDGFPMYGGFSGGLSILQIPPLDLQRVEIIKGASSALYGGDAMAGLVNFISKKPAVKPGLDFLLSQSQRGATDISSYFSGRKDRLGVTFLTTYDRQSPVDINDDGFADIPRSQTVTFNPKLFYHFPDSSVLSLSLNATSDNRSGGDIYAIKNQPDAAHPYLEQNISQRDYDQLAFEKKFSKGDILSIKNSVSYYDRKIILPGYGFRGKDVNSYSEASYLVNWRRHKTIAGLNLLTDDFTQNKALSSSPGNYRFTTIGAFLQDDWKMSRTLTAEMGLRGDEQNKYGFFALPRVAVLFKMRPQWAARLGGGLGYQVPTVFNTLPDQSDFTGVRPIGSQVKAPGSLGGNLDFSYEKALSDELTFSYDQSFFLTRINHPVIPRSDSLSKGIYVLENASSPEIAKGLESNFRVDAGDWESVADYTCTGARNRFDKARPHVPLDPADKVLLTLVYEDPDNIRAGVEGYYSGRQYLSDGKRAREYWTVDVMAEKTFRYLSIIANIENITDTRQSRFGPMVLPPYSRPVFSEIYAPVAGITANIELRIRCL
jgi:iron complex outermembrane receptor protein